MPIIRGPERVLTGAGTNHKTEFFGTKQVWYQFDNQTKAMIKWDVATVPFPIASVTRLTMQGNTVVLEEEQFVHRTQEREGDGVGGTRQRLLAVREYLEWLCGQQVAERHG